MMGEDNRLDLTTILLGLLVLIAIGYFVYDFYSQKQGLAVNNTTTVDSDVIENRLPTTPTKTWRPQEQVKPSVNISDDVADVQRVVNNTEDGEVPSYMYDFS